MLSESNPALRHGVIHLAKNLLTAFGQRLQAVQVGIGRVHLLAVSPNSPHQRFQLFLVTVLAGNFTRTGTICANIFHLSVLHQNAHKFQYFSIQTTSIRQLLMLENNTKIHYRACTSIVG